MNRKAYSTDLSEAEWRLLAPLIPPAQPGGRPRTTDMREVLDAIIIDSQSVKTTESGGVHGYDGAKKVGGRKRLLLVDPLG